MLSKAHLTSHSRMSGSRWVIPPSWLSGLWRSFLYSSSVYSCLENSMYRGAWRATVHGVAKSQTWRKQLSTRACTAALNMSANLENSAVATGLEKVSFHSNPKERQCQRMLKLSHNCTHLIPTPVFLPGEYQRRWSLVGCRLWGHTESDTTEVT